jgi:hypothetical protein
MSKNLPKAEPEFTCFGGNISNWNSPNSLAKSNAVDDRKPSASATLMFSCVMSSVSRANS